MSIKKYSSGQWVDVPYRKFETATDTFTTLPTEIIGDGQSASAVIKGNMQQSGTPTPQNPIYPSETGDKTANLFDKTTVTANTAIDDATGGTFTITNYNSSAYINISEFAQISILDTARNRWGAFYNANKTYISGFNGYGTLAVPQNAMYVRVTISNDYLNTFMLNGGDTLLPYEPFGYKIPISSANTTTPVYLGEVESTRQIKKLVLTGQESWTKSTSYAGNFYAKIILNPYTDGDVTTCPAFCSHAEKATTISPTTFVYGKFALDGDVSPYYINLYIGQANWSSADFKQYLADQFAAGTPVTIWYVLAEPTTGIVNEPIRKIGDYADSVTGTGLPTTGTAEQFDVDTTLKPSEVSLTYHGWHEHSDTVFTTE